MNDILICSDTIEEHARRVRMVFERIMEANFQLNLRHLRNGVPGPRRGCIQRVTR